MSSSTVRMDSVLFCSEGFSAAHHAARLSTSALSGQSALQSLYSLREELMQGLYKEAPLTSEFFLGIEGLNKALETTQTASKLQNSLKRVKGGDEAEGLEELENRCEQLCKNSGLLTWTKTFLQHMNRIDGLNTSNSSSSTCTISRVSYLELANWLRGGREAAEKEGVAKIKALERERIRLYARYAEYTAELETLLTNMIYGNGWERGGGKTDMDLIRAMDVLGGEGRAAAVIVANAHSRLMSVIREAFWTEMGRGVVSTASSTFTMGEGRMGGSLSSESWSSDGVGRESRMICKMGMERTKTRMLGILKRLEGLEGEEIKVGTEVVKEEMEKTLICLVSCVLGMKGGESFEVMIEGSGIVRNVYNLQTIYGNVEEIVKVSGSEGLKRVLWRGVEEFVKTIREDVKEKVGGIWGGRRGSLLQLGGGGGGVENVVQVVNGCMEVCRNVGAVGRRMGDIVVGVVIKGFVERAKMALDLVKGWTEAGGIVREMRGCGGRDALEKVWKRGGGRGKRRLEKKEWEAVVRVVVDAKVLERGVRECGRGVEDVGGKIKRGCEMLAVVVKEGLAILHAEVVWVCFRGVLEGVREDGGGVVKSHCGGFDEFGDRIGGGEQEVVPVLQVERGGLGEILVTMEEGVEKLDEEEQRFIWSDADAAVAFGIIVCAQHADVANAVRVFLDTTAASAAHLLGWPSVERAFSVAEGESISGAECRRLLYKAGLPI